MSSFMTVKKIHLYIGITWLIIFALTGQYMDKVLGPMSDMEDTPRMIWRAGHIYILFASLLNIVLGLYASPSPQGWRFYIQRIGSIILMLAPIILTIGFFYEAPNDNIERPITAMTVIFCLVGVLLHVLSVFKQPQE